MPKKLKPIPSFTSEEEERRFWETHDSFDYVDWDKAVRVRFPNLRFSSKNVRDEAADAKDSAAD